MENSMTEEKRIEGFLESDIRICIGKNEDDYLAHFEALPKRTFNIATAFFFGNWFAYRLMIKEACLSWLMELGVMLVGMILIVAFAALGIIGLDTAAASIKGGMIVFFLLWRILAGFVMPLLNRFIIYPLAILFLTAVR